MSTGWVAAGVRGRGLTRRMLGRAGARTLAAAPSLASALDALVRTPYGHDVRADMDLVSAGRAVFSTLLWHMRILAGWGPPLGTPPLRLLAAGFEIANVADHLARVEGRAAPDPYVLGSMATVWPAVSRARTAAQVRATLAASSWGDPGADDPGTIQLSLLFGWARRVLDGVPGSEDWAVSGAAVVLCRVLAAGAFATLGPNARRDARHVLGARSCEATSPGDLAGRLPRPAGRVLQGVTGADDLWRAEVRWWSMVEAAGGELVARPRPDASSSVGAVGLLAADAWRTRAALELAARGGGDLAEICDAVA